jgi:hypothetical protein
MMTTRWARAVRGLVVAAFATFTAALSHGIADGAHPPLLAVALGFAFSVLASIALLGRRMPRVALAAAIAVSQAFYHGLFSLFGPAAPSPSTIPTGAVGYAHVHVPMLFLPDAAGASVAAPVDSVMVAAHAVAAALTFWLAVYSQRLCAAVASLTRLVVDALAWLAASPAEPQAVRISLPHGARQAVVHRALVISSFLRHRGPPAGVRFA